MCPTCTKSPVWIWTTVAASAALGLMLGLKLAYGRGFEDGRKWMLRIERMVKTCGTQ